MGKIRCSNTIRSVVILVLLTLIAGCSGKDDGGNKNTNPDEITDISGTWVIGFDNIDVHGCDISDAVMVTHLNITQNGHQLTLIVNNDDKGTIQGSFFGNNIYADGNVQWSDGSRAYLEFNLTVFQGGAALSGQYTWERNEISSSCYGNEWINGIKSAGAP
jgi:hypothetical protein